MRNFNRRPFPSPRAWSQFWKFFWRLIALFILAVLVGFLFEVYKELQQRYASPFTTTLRYEHHPH